MEAATRFVDWVEPLLRRESYLALLVERAEVQQRLLRLLGLARWPMRYLMRHPGVIDELADERLLHSRFDAAEFAAELEARHEAWERSARPTPRRCSTRCAAPTTPRSSAPWCATSNRTSRSSRWPTTLGAGRRHAARTLAWAWKHLKQGAPPEPHFAGDRLRQAGRQGLGYGSDLDVVFLYDDEDERAAEVYGAFVRKLIGWLTLRTAAGELFEIDTAPAPNGNSGMLVTSMSSFEKYQSGRGSNTAWTWEHQALTRAGAPGCPNSSRASRRCAAPCWRRATTPRCARRCGDARKLRARAPVKEGRFDVKHSPGGMVDVEFAVQYLVLAHSAAHPGLLDNKGNIALLLRAQEAGLLPDHIGTPPPTPTASCAAPSTARLDEQTTQVDPETLAEHRDAVLALWRTVFG